MNKATVLEKIINSLQHELETYIRAAKFSHAEATAEENRAENKYDTRGLEASYLAAGQANKVVELEGAITSFEELKNMPAIDSVEIGALLELIREEPTNSTSSDQLPAAPRLKWMALKFSSSPRNHH